MERFVGYYLVGGTRLGRSPSKWQIKKDVMAEADAFYRNVYGSASDPLDANRSFSKPDRRRR